jgi:hypothetical protein
VTVNGDAIENERRLDFDGRIVPVGVHAVENTQERATFPFLIVVHRTTPEIPPSGLEQTHEVTS